MPSDEKPPLDAMSSELQPNEKTQVSEMAPPDAMSSELQTNEKTQISEEASLDVMSSELQTNEKTQISEKAPLDTMSPELQTNEKTQISEKAPLDTMSPELQTNEKTQISEIAPPDTISSSELQTNEKTQISEKVPLDTMSPELQTDKKTQLSEKPLALPPTPRKTPRTYRVWSPLFRHSYFIAHTSKPENPIANVYIASFFGPGLTLHAGATDSGHILATFNSATFGSTMTIYLGDPNSAGSSSSPVQECKLEKTGWTSSDFQISVLLGQKQPQQRKFTWRRNGWNSRSYKMVDERGGVVAQFVSDKAWFTTTLGTVEMMVDYGESFDHLVWIIAVGFCDRMRRQNNAAGAEGVAGASAAAV